MEVIENNIIMMKDVSQLVENIKHWSSKEYKEYFLNGISCS